MSIVTQLKQHKSDVQGGACAPTQIILGTLQWSRIYAEKHQLTAVEDAVNDCIYSIELGLRARGGVEAVNSLVDSNLLDIMKFSAVLAAIPDEQLPDAIDALTKHSTQ